MGSTSYVYVNTNQETKDRVSLGYEVEKREKYKHFLKENCEKKVQNYDNNRYKEHVQSLNLEIRKSVIDHEWFHIYFILKPNYKKNLFI